MTHKAKVLFLLRDGQPHSHHEGYRLGVILHSRVADLRADGHEIKSWRDGDEYMYQLVQRPLDEAEQSGCSASSSGPELSNPAAPTSQPSSTSSSRDGGDGSLELFPRPGRGAYHDEAA